MFNHNFVWQAQGILHLAKSEQSMRVLQHVQKTMVGVGLLKRICKDEFRVAGAVQETSPSDMLGSRR